MWARGAARAVLCDARARGDSMTRRDGRLEPGVVVRVAAHAVRRGARCGAARFCGARWSVGGSVWRHRLACAGWRGEWLGFGHSSWRDRLACAR